MSNSALAFFSVVLAAYLTLLFFWLRYEFQRPYFEPGRHWFQGLPEGIPGLFCRVRANDLKYEYQVCRIDEEGVFLFDAKTQFKAQNWGKKDLASLELQFRDLGVPCKGRLIRLSKVFNGLGFKFDGLDPDSRKDLTDFIERLRGEGYV